MVVPTAEQNRTVPPRRRGARPSKEGEVDGDIRTPAQAGGQGVGTAE